MRISIKSDGRPGGGISIITPSGDDLVKIATEVTWRMAVDEVSSAQITLESVVVEAVDAEARVYVGDREVRRIEYADGTTDEFPAP